MPKLLDFFDAVTDNDSKKVAAILQQGQDPNAVLDRDKLTPLHFAVLYSAVEVAKVLIEYGADLDAQDIEGWKPLDWALSGSNTGMVKLLSGD